MRTKAGIAAALLGLILLIAGIVQLVGAGAHAQVEAKLAPSESGYVLTEAGVLDLVNTKVHVNVKGASEDTAVTVAIGPSEDVQAWAGGLPVMAVAGLENWEALKASAREAEVEDTPPLVGSDMWIFEESGQGAVSFDYEVTEPGATSLIARCSDEGMTPELTLSWQRPGSGGLAVPLILFGVIVGAIGAILMAMSRGDKDGIPALIARARESAGARRAEKAGDGAALAKVAGIVSDSRDAQTEKTEGMLGAGIFPTADDDIRARELAEKDRILLPEPEVAAIEETAEESAEEAHAVSGESASAKAEEATACTQREEKAESAGASLEAQAEEGEVDTSTIPPYVEPGSKEAEAWKPPADNPAPSRFAFSTEEPDYALTIEVEPDEEFSLDAELFPRKRRTTLRRVDLFAREAKESAEGGDDA